MARSCFTLTTHRVFLFAFIQIDKGDIKMKKQKIRNERTYITEPIYNIASYYCNRNCDIYKRSSIRSYSSAAIILDYSYNVSKKQTKKGVK